MTKSVLNFFSKSTLLLLALVFSLTSQAQTSPELIFRDPVLVSGTANQQGALYRFSNVGTQNGQSIDAELRLRRFSRTDIVMLDVDLASLGWVNALQPQFGLAGIVPANQNWYIDFELTFFEGGKTRRKKMDKVDFTALDVDGDGWSISEYASFTNPSSVAFPAVSNLMNTPAGSLGQTLTCGECGTASPLVMCTNCAGGGDNGDSPCGNCQGSGALHNECDHAYQGVIGNILQGPVQNFNNIDTNATQVMATYKFLNTDQVKFRYGARSGSLSSNGSGIRLNSMWSKEFSMTPWVMLPVNFAGLAVLYTNGDAAISWQAPNGEALNHFTIQRSTDGKTYSDIATVLANTTTAAYQYKDRAVNSSTGVVYYRVLGVDKTKEAQYSAVKTLRLSASEARTIALTTYPNPVATDVRITLPHAWQGKAVGLHLYTAGGIMAKSIQLGSAGQTETLAMSGLAKGLYVVKATCGGQAAQRRIVKN
jgi:hypothetical protein